MGWGWGDTPLRVSFIPGGRIGHLLFLVEAKDVVQYPTGHGTVSTTKNESNSAEAGLG